VSFRDGTTLGPRRFFTFRKEITGKRSSLFEVRNGGRQNHGQGRSFDELICILIVLCEPMMLISAKSTDLVDFLFKKLWKIELSDFLSKAHKWIRSVHARQDYFDQMGFGRISCPLKRPSQFGLISDTMNDCAFSGVHRSGKTPHTAMD
jgi:hypothetical protein